MHIHDCTENTCVDQIQKIFHTAEVEVQREKRVKVKLRLDLVPLFLAYARDYLNFKHLAHISCVDWIEENEFELVFMLWSYEASLMLMVKTRIDRDKPEFITLSHLWPQAETYEREIHEMYGINFKGNQRLGEFILEDWEGIPPMRRDFDTIRYSQENFYQRPGREDAQDVREIISKHSGEKVPDFAKEFSIRRIEE